MNLLKGVKAKCQKTKYVYGDNEYYLCLNAIPLLDENEQFQMGVIVTHDITGLVKSNKLISSQKKELEIILDSISDSLIVIDKNGNAIKKNKSFYEQSNIHHCISNFSSVGDTALKGQKYYNDNDEELDIEELPGYKVLKGETVKQQRIIIKK